LFIAKTAAAEAAAAAGFSMSTDLALYEQLNKELVSLVDHFTNLVKATREGAQQQQQQQQQQHANCWLL
jgi:hypothetical protein